MKGVLLAICVLLIQGCAFSDSQLNIVHRPDANFKGPLAGLDATRFEVKPLIDQRQDQARIGWKKNGYGQNTADITASRPVVDIVGDALRAGFEGNGHTTGTPADITVSGAVTRFWFEVDPNFFTVEFIGNVECDLLFTEARSGKSLYKSRYNGTFSKKTGGGLEATWTEVMRTAVEKTVEDMAFDADLVESLQARQ